jgi:GntR family transcriptional repressor for pyruvate dehydrogenase complex
MANAGRPQGPALAPVARSRLYELLAERLVEHVQKAGLGPGDRLPAERALAEQFGVSRTSVRQALVSLEVQGVVEVRHGGGVFLVDPQRVDPRARLWKRAERLSDVYAVREALEVKIAELAAEHCREEDRRLMEQALEDMQDDLERGGLGAAADAAFHRAVTVASQNPVMVDLMEYVADRIWESRIESLSQPGRGPVSLAGHREIAAAIAAGDPAAARDAMRAHVGVMATVELTTMPGGAADPPAERTPPHLLTSEPLVAQPLHQ